LRDRLVAQLFHQRRLSIPPPMTFPVTGFAIKQPRIDELRGGRDNPKW
jgi:hypothetical protein